MKNNVKNLEGLEKFEKYETGGLSFVTGGADKWYETGCVDTADEYQDSTDPEGQAEHDIYMCHDGIWID